MTSIVLSLEEGIRETVVAENLDCRKEGDDVPSDASFELVPSGIENVDREGSVYVVSVNAGGEDIEAEGAVFLEDSSFRGGDVTRTNASIGDGGSESLYQTARIGNFSYSFGSLEPGKYIVDLHFAEIVFVDGPPGMRLFDVYIQEEKVKKPHKIITTELVF